MNSIQKRFLLFLFGCIGVRLFLVYLAKTLSPTYLTYMAYLSILVASSFTILFIGDFRKTGAEVFGGKIWWNSLRPFHAFTYFLFAAMVLSNTYKNMAWLVLLTDVIVGFFSFLWFHYSNSNFSQLFTI